MFQNCQVQRWAIRHWHYIQHDKTVTILLKINKHDFNTKRILGLFSTEIRHAITMFYGPFWRVNSFFPPNLGVMFSTLRLTALIEGNISIAAGYWESHANIWQTKTKAPIFRNNNAFCWFHFFCLFYSKILNFEILVTTLKRRKIVKFCS